MQLLAFAGWFLLSIATSQPALAHSDYAKGVHTEGDTHSLPGGPYCSLPEAIYATEFGTNVALDQTDPDDTSAAVSLSNFVLN